MSAEEPRCPECGVAVQPDWDWCHGCGYDPDHLRPADTAPEAPVGPPPMQPGAPPASPAPSAQPVAPPWRPPVASTPPTGSGPSNWAPPAAPGSSTDSRSTAVLVAVAAGVGLVVVAILALGAVTLLGRQSDSGSSSEASTTGQAASSSGAAHSSSGRHSTSTGAAPETPPDMFATPDNPSVVIDEPTAMKVLSAFWPVHKEGMRASDASLLATVETGAALDLDSVTCFSGCNWYTTPFTSEPRFAAPTQSGYPANFVAQVEERCGCAGSTKPADAVDHYFIVFTRESADAPWLAAIVAGGSGAGVLLNDATVFGAPVPPPSGDVVPIEAPQLYVEYFDTYKRTGAPPPGNPVGRGGAPQQDGEAAANGLSYMESLGYSNETTYRDSSGEDGFFAYAAGPGTYLACSAIRWTTVTTTDPPGGRVTQGADGPFARVVAPGDYSRVETEGVRDMCFVVNTSGVVSVGMDGGNYSANLTPF